MRNYITKQAQRQQPGDTISQRLTNAVSPHIGSHQQMQPYPLVLFALRLMLLNVSIMQGRSLAILYPNIWTFIVCRFCDVLEFATACPHQHVTCRIS